MIYSTESFRTAEAIDADSRISLPTRGGAFLMQTTNSNLSF